MMNFFKALRERAIENIRGDTTSGRAGPLKRKWVNRGIIATIEALKEMMVGEPIGGVLRHPGEEGWLDIGKTMIDTGNPCTSIYLGSHHGTDGEEIVVMVFRVEEKD